MYGGYGYDDDEIIDTQEYMNEVNVYDRAVFGDVGDTVEQIAMDAGVVPDDRKKGTKFTNNIWRFYVYVNASARRMIDEGIVQMRQRDVVNILKHIKLIDNPEFKNPDTFVLGYSIVNRGSIDKSALKQLIPKLPQNIKPTDVVRYARLVIG